MTTLAVVSAGLGRPSSTRLLADRLAAATTEALRADTAVETIELRDHAHAMVDATLTGFPSGTFRAAVEAVTGADGLIAVTPVFNASYTGLFKTFFDVLDRDALEGTPVLLGATGGTARHSLAIDYAMRPLFAYLRTSVVPTAVYAASEDWGSGETALPDRVARAGAELAALMEARPAPAKDDPYENPVPFERLLAGR
ncbi:MULTISPECIES: FMN reductase [Actinomadura]|uniref:FMN reductase n=1 Tax=Actinomadura madurae TaxID=1993 RepID=A0A1I5IC70_9ACTN|nr:FMN reductase [Actinomadura madurae]MCP9965255.1 FMN reductase [Actinomadura madurae]MCP9977747.1 FMN reductase [Actinomadura madurae]MCQ0010762.1 FMN reductase [Actinomadura madurae]MCQ0013932.1 FMN reductase [Actinomadura madurae]URM94121.1 FMN reductase [Actinomadura madurae]